VLGLVAALSVPLVSRSTGTLRARSEIARLSAMFRHAREQAITTRRPHVVVLEPKNHLVKLMDGTEVRQTRTLASDLTVESGGPAPLSVRFEPHGVSSGGDFRVATAGVRYRITVDSITGRVRSARE
jgi:Tfp pilus assembly protein FimT